MVDNIIQLDMVMGETLERMIRIVKTRGSSHELRRFPLRITATGIQVDRPR
jgi:KaiC/GvpD/RAD55 family RecA-like ATPase